MTLATCPPNEQLLALSLGRLPEDQSDELLQHLRECDACQAELATSDAGEDTLVAQLRVGASDAYLEEPDCQVALAKALGAMAEAEDADQGHEDGLPERLGEYEIVRPIGRGGMGNVYLARHTKLGRFVAVKALFNHRLVHPRMRRRFEVEMQAVGQLSHPCIVTAHDAREVDGVAVLVTEFIDGLDTGQLTRRLGRLPVAEACEIARQVALALEYVDMQGLVHRDVKPSNIMVSRRGEVKLLDLGLARFNLTEVGQEQTGTGQTIGTADYVAPEQVSDSRQASIRADIYALGCTLFKLLSGRPPFDDERYPTSFAKMTAHVSAAPPPLQQAAPDAPRKLAELVDRMLCKNPAGRPQSPGDVARQLEPLARNANLSQLVDRAIAAEQHAIGPRPQPIHKALDRGAAAPCHCCFAPCRWPPPSPRVFAESCLASRWASSSPSGIPTAASRKWNRPTEAAPRSTTRATWK